VAFSSPPIVATGDYVTATLWNTYVRGNGLHLRGLLPDAASPNQVLTAATTTTAAFGLVGTATIADSNVTTAKIADLNVTTAKIADLNVTTAKIANGAVTDVKIAAAAVHAVNIVDGTITDVKIANLNVTTAKIADLNVTTAKIANGAVTAAKLDANAAIPSGLVAWFETLAELTAAGAAWARYTAADGRLLVGAGTTFGQTFTQATNYGANWTPSSGITAAAGLDSAEVSPYTGRYALAAAGGGAGSFNAQTVDHGHAVTLTGTASAWLPPLRAGVFGRKS